ncbi:MAG: hypothetical protein WBV74_06090 [Pseudonocardiaceae bacterium]
MAPAAGDDRAARRDRLVVTFAITFVYVWLFNHTGGSVLMTMLLHITQGTVSYAALGFTDADAARMDLAHRCPVVRDRRRLLDRHAWRAASPSAIVSPGSVPSMG